MMEKYFIENNINYDYIIYLFYRNNLISFMQYEIVAILDEIPVIIL